MSQFNDERTQINFANHFPSRSVSDARRPGTGFSALLGGISARRAKRSVSAPAVTLKRADHPAARRSTDSRDIAMASIRSLIWR